MTSPSEPTTRETWPCGECGHKHFPSEGCPDHQWTDSCPYEGLDCWAAVPTEAVD